MRARRAARPAAVRRGLNRTASAPPGSRWMRLNMTMDNKNNNGIACKIRLMIYLPISASNEQPAGTAHIGHTVLHFLQRRNYYACRHTRNPLGGAHRELATQRHPLPAATSLGRKRCSTQAGQVPPSHHHNQMFSAEPYPTAEGR